MKTITFTNIEGTDIKAYNDAAPVQELFHTPPISTIDFDKIEAFTIRQRLDQEGMAFYTYLEAKIGDDVYCLKQVPAVLSVKIPTHRLIKDNDGFVRFDASEQGDETRYIEAFNQCRQEMSKVREDMEAFRDSLICLLDSFPNIIDVNLDHDFDEEYSYSYTMLSKRYNKNEFMLLYPCRTNFIAKDVVNGDCYGECVYNESMSEEDKEE